MDRTQHTTRAEGARTAALIGGAIALAIAAGCRTGPRPMAAWDDDARNSTNAWAVRTAFRNQVEAGIARRRTVYEHHFVAGTATLNPRGRREVEIIADHLGSYGGGEVYFESGIGEDERESELYALRKDAIRRLAAAEGLGPDELTIMDGINTTDTVPTPEAARRWSLPSLDEPYDIHGGGGASLGGGGQ